MQVTSDSSGKVTAVEAINDVSSAFLYKGIYHVFHQWCVCLCHSLSLCLVSLCRLAVSPRCADHEVQRRLLSSLSLSLCLCLSLSHSLSLSRARARSLVRSLASSLALAGASPMFAAARTIGTMS